MTQYAIMAISMVMLLHHHVTLHCTLCVYLPRPGVFQSLRESLAHLMLPHQASGCFVCLVCCPPVVAHVMISPLPSRTRFVPVEASFVPSPQRSRTKHVASLAIDRLIDPRLLLLLSMPFFVV